jgi:SAM-dependent methyltransferase
MIVTTQIPAPVEPGAEPNPTEALTARLFNDLLGAFSLAGVYLGRELGLYDALREGGPLTSSELAERAGVAERYAREWLEHQAANGILRLEVPSPDALERRYLLPEAHAGVLADRDDIDYFAWAAQGVAAAFARLPDVALAFRTGGGVAWDAYGETMREMQGDANRNLFLKTLPQEYLPVLTDVHARLAAGGRVAEVGSGLGWAAIGIARAYPGVTVDGFDIDERSVELAAANATSFGIDARVQFHALDAAEAPSAGQYDLVAAFECIHDMPDPVSVLTSMRRLVAPGGAVVVMDERAGESFQAPADDVERFLYGFSLTVCLPDGMSHQPSVGTGTVMRPQTFRGYALDAGFREVEVLEALDHPFFQFYRLHP